MILYLILAVLYGGLFFLSSQMEAEEEVKWYRKPFFKMALWITNRLPGIPEKKKQRERDKWELALAIGFCGLALLPVLDLATTKKPETLVDHTLERPEKGEGEKEISIQAYPEDEEEPTEIRIQLKERKYTEKEKQEMLKKAEEEIDAIVLGENESADEVRGRIFLPSSVLNGEVSIQWIQDPQGLIEEDGTITEDLTEDGEILNLQAVMNCNGTEQIYSFGLHLFPLLLNEEEQFQADLKKAVLKAEEDSGEKKEMVLPVSVNGKGISWVSPGSKMTELCMGFVLFLAVLGYLGKEQEYKKEEEHRHRQLLLDYPDLVFKLGMLLNAGLTIQNAFTRIASEYKEQRTEEKKRYAYEEMLFACNEMQSGVSEARAYENFGHRCRETCYVRLGTTLSGGIQKSAEGITTLLLKEADTAMEDRRQMARKLGEEAGTKLLFPMILMLLVVMVILMVPAMLSF